MGGRKHKAMQPRKQLHHYLVRRWGEVGRKTTNILHELSPSFKKNRNHGFVHVPTNIHADSLKRKLMALWHSHNNSI